MSESDNSSNGGYNARSTSKCKSKFIHSLFEMSSSDVNKSVIGFSKDGDCLEIRDSKRLGNEVLPRYFKHQQLNSFIRQLNNYGFRTIPSASNSTVFQTFVHEFFHRGRMDLLSLIIRKGSETTTGKKEQKMVTEIEDLKVRDDWHRKRVRELEHQNAEILETNRALMEENNLLKASWNYMQETVLLFSNDGSDHLKN